MGFEKMSSKTFNGMLMTVGAISHTTLLGVIILWKHRDNVAKK